MFANAASNSTIYNTASQIKRTVVHASTADDMTCQQDGALHINLPASPPREHLLHLLLLLVLILRPTHLITLSRTLFFFARRLYKTMKMRGNQQEEGKRMRVNLPGL